MPVGVWLAVLYDKVDSGDISRSDDWGRYGMCGRYKLYVISDSLTTPVMDGILINVAKAVPQDEREQRATNHSFAHHN